MQLWGCFLYLVRWCWFAFGLVLSLHATSLLSTLVSYSSASLWGKESILLQVMKPGYSPLPVLPLVPLQGGGWWLLFSLAGQLFLILLLCCTFLKRPLVIYNTIKSIFLWCNFPFPAYFVSDSAECVINFLL